MIGKSLTVNGAGQMIVSTRPTTIERVAVTCAHCGGRQAERESPGKCATCGAPLPEPFPYIPPAVWWR